MTKVEPATGWTWDYEIAIIEQELEKGGALFGPLTVRRLVGRIRQEQTAKDVAQRRAEAAERVVRAQDGVLHAYALDDRAMIETAEDSLDAVRKSYDAAKAAGFPKEG